MEQLRNDAKRLAIINVVLPMVFSLVSTFSLGILCGNPMQMHLKAHTILLTFIGVPIFVLFFYFWMQLLADLERAYEGSDNMKYAVKMGRLALVLKMFASAIGFVAALVAVSRSGVFNISVNSYEYGLILKGGTIEFICKSLIAASSPFTAIMYVLMFDMTARKTDMRFLTLTLSVLSMLFITAVVADTSKSPTLWGLLQLAVGVVEFLFLWKIYKGAEFK